MMSHYRVRVKFANVEIEVDSSEQAYADAKLKEMISKFGAPKGGGGPEVARRAEEPETSPNPNGERKPLSMVEYVRSLAPKSGTQYVVAVGDYLEKQGGMSSGFRTRDIVTGFQTVKYKHANPAEAVRQAKQQGFLMDGKEPGTVLVTNT